MTHRNPKTAAACGGITTKLEALGEDWPEDEPGVPTEEIAAFNHSKPPSIREHLSRRGHYYGLRPRRLPNGRLTWPPNYRDRLREYGATLEPRTPAGPRSRRADGKRSKR